MGYGLLRHAVIKLSFVPHDRIHKDSRSFPALLSAEFCHKLCLPFRYDKSGRYRIKRKSQFIPDLHGMLHVIRRFQYIKFSVVKGI